MCFLIRYPDSMSSAIYIHNKNFYFFKMKRASFIHEAKSPLEVTFSIYFP